MQSEQIAQNMLDEKTDELTKVSDELAELKNFDFAPINPFHRDLHFLGTLQNLKRVANNQHFGFAVSTLWPKSVALSSTFWVWVAQKCCAVASWFGWPKSVVFIVVSMFVNIWVRGFNSHPS